MIISNHQSSNNLHFTGIKIAPKISQWPKDVLDSALNSKTIQEIITQDAKNWTDTFITYEQENRFPNLPKAILKVNNKLRLVGSSEIGDWHSTCDQLARKIRELDIEQNLDTTIQKLGKKFGVNKRFYSGIVKIYINNRVATKIKIFPYEVIVCSFTFL